MKPTSMLLLCLLVWTSCKENSTEGCPSLDQIVSQFTQPTGEEVIIDEDGKVYLIETNGCSYQFDYYPANFLEKNYEVINGKVLIKSPDGNIPTASSAFEDFESYDNALDLFYQTIEEVGEKIWGAFTLQSPSAKTVEEYVALRNCILDGTCDFIDNRFDLVNDPKNITNKCIKFTAVDKTDDMITCKSSMRSSLFYFDKGDDFWFSADFLITGNIPTTLADFENEYFEGSPGPRLLISNDRLAIENKFGAKVIYRHDKDITVPTDQWFNTKVHLKLSDQTDGLVELWQDDVLLLSVSGINMPLANSIQNSIEIGVSATNEACLLFVDNIRIDHEPF